MQQKLDFTRDGRNWPNREASRFVDAAGIKWHVQVMGNGPVVLLVHGTAASSHSFGDLAKLLYNGFTVVVPDLPGHGFTNLPPASRLSLPSMAADLSALMLALELSPSLVVGHSAGAAILSEMCLDGLIAPDAIISINGALLPFDGVASQFFSPIAKLLALNPIVPKLFAWRASSGSAVERLIENTGSRLEPESLGCYQRLFQSEVHVEAALGMMAGWDLHTLQKRLEGLKCPLILVVGSDDRAVSPGDAFEIRDRLPNAEVVLLRGLGHLAHEEWPEKIAEIVDKAAQSILA
ncbi:MAG: alpha/beta fold hydrolase BchO [Pseudomonadota bacterium]